MSAKQPEIKFSPFEALLIGEKNRVLKRQPMKNTIFVTKLNQKSRTINLRALFGLEKSPTKSKSHDDIFKMPQRVHEFLNNKKHNYENNKIKENKEENMLHNEWKGHQTFVKNNDSVKPKHKKSKIKSKKVKFKEKCSSEKLVNKVQNPLKTHPMIRRCNLIKRSGGMSDIVLRERKDMCSSNRYELRGKDCKFTCDTEYDCLQSEEVNSLIHHEDLTNYVCKFLTDNNKNIFDNDNQTENENLQKFQIEHLLENIVDMSEWQEQFNNSSDPDTLLNKLCKHNYYYYGDFEFPNCPETEMSDFDDDENLVDIVYEQFPKSFKFESEDPSHDFFDALISANIIEPVEELEIEEIDLTGEDSEQGEKFILSCSTQTSNTNLPKPPIDLSSCYHLKTLENEYIATADGFVAIQNHLITDENFGSLFLSNRDGHDKNDLIMARLMKPLIHNTWVKSLQNF